MSWACSDLHLAYCFLGVVFSKANFSHSPTMHITDLKKSHWPTRKEPSSDWIKVFRSFWARDGFILLWI